MKNSLLVVSLVILLFFTFSCQNKAEKAELEKFRAQAKLEEQNKELVLKLHEGWKKGDIEALKQIMSPEYVWHVVGRKTLSLKVFLEGCKKQIINFPDRTFIYENLIIKENQVVTRYIFKGTLEGEIEGFPATGKKVEIEGIAIDRIENGKIVETWEVADFLSLYQQLGIELKPKGIKK